MPKYEDLPKQNDEALARVLGKDSKSLFPRSQVGRIRLVRALSNKFGQNFELVPEAKEALREHDSETEFLKKYLTVKRTGGRK